MQNNFLYEYAVIRVVPRVEREEFMNIGVVLYCSGKKFLKVMFELDKIRLTALSDKLDIEEIKNYLCAFEQICNGEAVASTISTLPIAERFRWLTATRSTIVQSSKIHPGFCTDPQATLDRLFVQLVKQ